VVRRSRRGGLGDGVADDDVGGGRGGGGNRN